MSTTSLDLTSFEADAKQLRLAREQGAAYRQALEHMVQSADCGGMHPAAEYLIGYALRPAEGSHDPVDGTLSWSEPGSDEVLLAVAVCDSSDGRFVPGLSVTATFVDDAGEDVATHELGLSWDPLLYHYAANVRAPGRRRVRAAGQRRAAGVLAPRPPAWRALRPHRHDELPTTCRHAPRRCVARRRGRAAAWRPRAAR